MHTSARVGMWRVPLHVRDLRVVRHGGITSAIIAKLVIFLFFFFLAPLPLSATWRMQVESWFSS